MKYHPEDSVKRKEEQMKALKVFLNNRNSYFIKSKQFFNRSKFAIFTKTFSGYIQQWTKLEGFPSTLRIGNARGITELVQTSVIDIRDLYRVSETKQNPDPNPKSGQVRV